MDRPSPPPSPDPVAQAWEKVDRAWEDAEGHERFIALCLTLDRLGDAGARYRHVRDTAPSRRAEAERRIEQILRAATERLRLERSEPIPRAPRGVRLALLVVSVLAMATATWLWLHAG